MRQSSCEFASAHLHKSAREFARHRHSSLAKESVHLCSIIVVHAQQAPGTCASTSRQLLSIVHSQRSSFRPPALQRRGNCSAIFGTCEAAFEDASLLVNISCYIDASVHLQECILTRMNAYKNSHLHARYLA
jgi:hypothetical protein